MALIRDSWPRDTSVERTMLEMYKDVFDTGGGNAHAIRAYMRM